MSKATHQLPAGIGWPLATNFIRRGMKNHTYGHVRNGGVRVHQGWDFEAEPGFRTYAIADGEVAMVRSTGAYGKHVILKFRFDLDNDGSKETLYAVYCHLSRVDVKPGQRLKLGDQLGMTGNSGNARGMRGKDQHLHFEIRTGAITGRGLTGRMSPYRVFHKCPMKAPVKYKGPFQRL